MSVLDQFRSAEQRVAKRLRELKPLVEEYHALEQVAERLGLDVDEDATVRGEYRPASPGSGQGRSRGSKSKARSAASTREESGAAAPATGSAATAPPRRARPRRAGRKGGPGSNRSSRRQQDVLRLVNQRPGITVREIGEELGVDPTSLYRPVHKLEQEGAISKRGAALEPSGR
ncbi:MAG: MarR family transcriptional regulator [Thermoleophilaceae bacterium]|nr:MarR family transcriptional regulator [Thermoleophilaceae bacterium]